MITIICEATMTNYMPQIIVPSSRKILNNGSTISSARYSTKCNSFGVYVGDNIQTINCIQRKANGKYHRYHKKFIYFD